ncbi:unnamed protein product [Rotaria sordida]|uniref:Uncharacterized protein n=2 Tax=Rotaria sordida TaxID=392033 RepID=A0A820AEP1_9BILA|nr:unnamed protein product [Rotaria sordida]CAF4190742.1 unnamed protein product [Rotaria sordida]
MASSSHSTSTQTSLSTLIVGVEHDAVKRDINGHDTKNDKEEMKLKQNKNSHKAKSNEMTYHYVPVFAEEDQMKFEELFPDYSNIRKSFD